MMRLQIVVLVLLLQFTKSQTETGAPESPTATRVCLEWLETHPESDIVAQEAQEACKPLVDMCLDELMMWCGSISPGEGRVLQCLQDHAPNASASCAQAFTELPETDPTAPFADACEPERVKFCPDVKIVDHRGLMKCFKANWEELAEPCKDEIKAIFIEKMGPCAEDVKELCGDVQPGEGRIVRCLRRAWSEGKLSQECVDWVKEKKGGGQWHHEGWGPIEEPPEFTCMEGGDCHGGYVGGGDHDNWRRHGRRSGWVIQSVIMSLLIIMLVCCCCKNRHLRRENASLRQGAGQQIPLQPMVRPLGTVPAPQLIPNAMPMASAPVAAPLPVSTIPMGQPVGTAAGHPVYQPAQYTQARGGNNPYSTL